MKFLCSGDWHLDKKDIKLSKEGFYIPLLKRAEEIILETKPDKLILLGDIFHSKDMVSTTLSELFGDFLKRISEYNFLNEIVTIVGNHDFSLVSEDKYYHAYWKYKDFDKVSVVDTFYRITENIGCISYCRERDLFLDRKKALGDVRCLIMHQDIKGFLKGDDYIEDKFYLSTDELDCELVLSGHYHTAQLKEINGRRYVYAGSFQSTNFAESDDFKSVVLLDSESLEIERIPTGMTFHKTIKINVDEDLPEIPEEEIKRGVQYRVIVEGTKEEFELKQIPREYAKKIKIQPKFKKSDKKKIELRATDTIEDIISKYTEEEISKNYTNENFDLEKIKSEGIKLFKKGKKKRLG